MIDLPLCEERSTITVYGKQFKDHRFHLMMRFLIRMDYFTRNESMKNNNSRDMGGRATNLKSLNTDNFVNDEGIPVLPEMKSPA